MKRLMIAVAVAAAMVMVADAQGKRKVAAVGADGGELVAKGKDAQVVIPNKFALGQACLQYAPLVNGESPSLRISRRKRQWIVSEFEYKTAADWQDELTVTWHILLDANTTKFSDKPSKDKEPIPRFSYYTTSVRYVDIPKGSHAASVLLPPGVFERYGAPAVISVRITNKEGDMLCGQDAGTDTLGMPKDWFADDQVFSAKDKKGTLKIARRQGLLERSKTIFALINPDYYEMVQQ